jgi:hypothetical protein
MKLLILSLISIIFCQDNNETIIDDVNQEKQERKDLMQDWELMMQDFIPDDMLAFELKKGEIEILEEGIHHPTTIRGAYFVSMMTKEKINFIVII